MTCISTLPAYQTGYHLYDLQPEILLNPYQPKYATALIPVMLLLVRHLILIGCLDGLGLSTALRPSLRLHQNFTSDNVSSWVYLHPSLTRRCFADSWKGYFQAKRINGSVTPSWCTKSHGESHRSLPHYFNAHQFKAIG
jgi:hypothetical protein